MYGFFAYLADEGKTHVRNGCRPVQTPLFLHLGNNMLQHFLLIFGQLKGFQYPFIPFHQLAGSKFGGDSRRLGVVIDQMHNTMQTAMHCPAMV